jgi:hypothetical protein
LEYRLAPIDSDFSYDIFFTYRESKADLSQWCSYHLTKKVYRRNLPNFSELCSAELLNNLYMVPCDPEEYLNVEYGSKGWQKPMSSKYKWPNLEFHQEYSDLQYIKSIKYYFENGTFDKYYTLDYLNRGLKKKIDNISLYIHYLKITDSNSLT